LEGWKATAPIGSDAKTGTRSPLAISHPLSHIAV
jgi:hypothetical protein